VVWQFWGRAAEASWTEKSRALFYMVLYGSEDEEARETSFLVKSRISLPTL
jgi:hypothetical protein